MIPPLCLDCCIIQLHVFDPLTAAFLSHSSLLMQLYISQPLGAGAAGEDPGQPPKSGEGLLQQRAMSVQPPHPNTAITQLQAQSSPLCQPSSFSVPMLGLCLLISTIQMDIWGLPLSVGLFVMRCLLLSMWLLILLLTAWEDLLPSGLDEKYDVLSWQI